MDSEFALSLTRQATLAPGFTTLAMIQSPRRGPNPPSVRTTVGPRVGAPSDQALSAHGRSHKHLWVEHQPYGEGRVNIPRSDTAVHQSNRQCGCISAVRA
jgi:hypothetical protein